ncbi:MAG: ABC transporter substrate-binding protein, partial [Anaerolineales bacterium]
MKKTFSLILIVFLFVSILSACTAKPTNQPLPQSSEIPLPGSESYPAPGSTVNQPQTNPNEAYPAPAETSSPYPSPSSSAGQAYPAATQGEESTANTTLRMVLLPIIDNLPMYVAQQEGLFAKYGVSVEFIPVASAAERDQVIAAGQGDG